MAIVVKRSAAASIRVILGSFSIAFVREKRLIVTAPVGTWMQQRNGRESKRYFLRCRSNVEEWSGLPAVYMVQVVRMWSSESSSKVASCMCISLAGSRVVPPENLKSSFLVSAVGMHFIRG